MNRCWMLLEESADIFTNCTLTEMKCLFGNDMEMSWHLGKTGACSYVHWLANDFNYRQSFFEYSLLEVHVFMLLCNSSNIAV